MNGVEETVNSWLISKGLFPFSVLYVKRPQFLKISFYLESEVQELLDLTGFSKVCDNSGVQCFPDTILFTGTGLINLMRHVDNGEI